MLIQLLLDFASEGIALALGLIPPLPPEIDGAMDDVVEGMTYFEDRVFALGIVVPFEAITVIVNVWLSTLALWVSCLFAGTIVRMIRGG